MHIFEYDSVANGLFTLDIVNLLSAIHEYKGKQDLYVEAKADVLFSLLKIAKIQSTEASNRIEGIYTSDARLKEIMQTNTPPKTRNEKEIAGYRDVLATIHDNYEYMIPRPNMILQLHRDLYSFSGASIGGHYKHSDNIIEEQDSSGSRIVRFTPVSSFETPEAIEQLCNTFLHSVDRGKTDPLLLIPIFVLDFLCIHPFNDGNGRMSRLLTLLLLYRAGYIVGKYISIEKIIEKTKDTYYDSLQESSAKWHENQNDYKPFIEYSLGVILNAYKEFATRVEYMTAKNMTAAQRIQEIVRNKVGKITKKEITEICPDINEGTVERALGELVKNGVILKIGGGRYTAYTIADN